MPCAAHFTKCTFLKNAKSGAMSAEIGNSFAFFGETLLVSSSTAEVQLSSAKAAHSCV